MSERDDEASKDIDRDACLNPEARAKVEPVSFGDMFAPMIARAESARLALEKHAAECKDPLCDRCGRFPCRRCKAVVDMAAKLCDACWRVEAIVVAKASVPKRFQWALGADRDRLLETASRLPPLSVDSGLAWARAQQTQGLLLRGDPGMGKTSLVVALFGAWLHVHGDDSARFVEAFELAYARARHPLGQGEAPAVERAIRAGLLVLDDLGSEDATKATVMSDVLMARHNADRPTWCTSWLKPEEMAQRYGAGVCRRVFEGAKVVVLA